MSAHKPKSKNIPTEVLKALIRHHIPYELSMMRNSLAHARAEAPTQFQHNLYVEGFALHARNLIDVWN